MSDRDITIAVYVVIGVALLVTEVVARRSDTELLTFSRLIQRVMEHRSAQLGMLLAWWWVGWHFLPNR